jgi:protein-disulfide isomerase
MVCLPFPLLVTLTLVTAAVVAAWSVWQPGKTAQANVDVSVDDDPAWGPTDAPVIIVEFGDYQCPYCKQFHDETLPQISETYEGQIRFVFRDFPLSGVHPWAQKAAEASECADDQERFWDYHDLLWANQSALDVDSLEAYAAQLGLDTATFDDCLDSGANAEEVQNDFEDGVSYGVAGTPTFFVNGIKVVGAQPFSVFQTMIDSLLAPPVGGVAELPDVAQGDSWLRTLGVLALGATALLALAAGACYARRRRLG